MYGIFFVLLGQLVFEGVSALPTSEENDIKINLLNKYSKRRMIHGKRYKDEDPGFTSSDKPVEKSSDKPVDKSLENVISAIDSGVKTFMESDNKSDIIGNMAKSLIDLVKDNGKKSVFRSKAEEYVKPELIHFRNDPEKASIMLELNSQSIINGLKDLLETKLVHKLTHHYSKEAAMVYRSIKNELDKQ